MGTDQLLTVWATYQVALHGYSDRDQIGMMVILRVSLQKWRKAEKRAK